MKNNGFSWVKRYILQNCNFAEKFERSSKNLPKFLLKSSRNPPKIDEKSKKIDKKSHDDA